MRRWIVILVLVALSPVAGLQAGEKDELRGLVRRLEDPATREAAARSLLEKGDSALPHLTWALKAVGSSDLLRREVVALLPRFGAKGIGPLKAALGDRRVELEAVRQLATIDASEKVFPVMFQALDSANPRVRGTAISWIKSQPGACDRGLRETGATGKDLSKKLFQLLGDPSEEVRNAAGELIGRALGRDAVPTLMNLFRKEVMHPTRSNVLLRQVLIRTLGVVGRIEPTAADRVIPTLIQALYRKDQQKAASSALVGLGERAVPSLLMVLKQGDVKRAPAAMEAMMQIGPEAAPEVVSLLTARHGKMRELSLQFLSFYRDPAILPILMRTFQKGDPLVRTNVISIVGLYRQDEAVRLLELGLKDLDAGVRLKAMEMIAKSDLPQTVPLLLSRAEEDPELNIRIAALQALFYLGEMSAVPSMVRMLQYEKWPIRMEILKALLWMGRAGHVGPIAEQLAHRKPEIANLAKRTLANLSYLEGERSLEGWSRSVGAILKAGLGEHDTPLSVNRKEIHVGKEVIEVLVAGTPDHGTLLLLRSGDGLDDTWFLEALRPLVDDYRIVLMDFPGCGFQDGDSRPEAKRCMAWHGERIELVRSAFTSGKVVLISHSVASYAAAWYAAKRPDAVSKLILIAPVYPEPTLLRDTVRRIEDGIPTRWGKELDILEGLRGRMNPRAYHRYRHRAELAALVSGQGNASLVTSYYGMSWFLHETWLPEGDSELEAAFVQIRAPVLLIIGENDPTPPESLALFRRIGRIRGNYLLAMVPNAMHFPHISQPVTFRSAVTKFLTEVEGVRGAFGAAGLVPSAVVSMGERGLTTAGEHETGPVSLHSVGPEPVGLSGLMNPDTMTPPTESAEDHVSAGEIPQSEHTSPHDSGFAETSPGDSNRGLVSKAFEPRRAPFWPWFTLALSGAVAAAGGVVNHLALEDGRRADRLDPLTDNYARRFDGLISDAQTKMIIAYSGYGLGAAGVGVGLWLLLSTPKATGTAARWSLEPILGVDGPAAPVGLRGMFRF